MEECWLGMDFQKKTGLGWVKTLGGRVWAGDVVKNGCWGRKKCEWQLFVDFSRKPLLDGKMWWQD